MIVYLSLMSVLIFSYFIFSNKDASTQRLLLIIVAIIFIIFTGFRYEVSLDWGQYLRMYNKINQDTSLINALSVTEPSFVLLNWFMGKLGAGVYGVNFIVSIIFISGLFKFSEKMPNPWLSLISVTPYLVIVISMSAVRQTAAIGIILYLLAGWNKDDFLKKIILSLLATSFHYSAFIAFLFVIQSMKMPLWIRWNILLIGGIITFIIFSKTEQYTIYENTYVTQNIESYGAFQHVLLNAIPATIYLLFIRKWNEVYIRNNLMMILSYLSLLSIIGVFFSSTAVDRLALYLSPIQMLVYGSIPTVFKSQTSAIAIISIHIAILLIWLLYANSSYAFLPYKNILFL